MSRLIRTQRGITLVELLVTLGILSFIGTLIWGVYFQGFNYSQKSMMKNTLQQEANLVIVNLTKIHQTSSQYQISSSDCNITVIYTSNQDHSQHTQIFSKNGLCYSTTVTGTFDPSQDDVNLTVTIYDQKDTNNKVDVNAFLYRLK